MKLIVEKNFERMSGVAAEIMAQFISENPMANICFPTGGSVVGVYERLCEAINARSIPTNGLKCFGMDEYVPFTRDNPDGYYYFVNKHVYSKLGIEANRTFAIKAFADDPAQACREYAALIDGFGGLDFTLLGVGTDGHVAFNMPSDRLCPDPHVEELSEETIESNSRFFASRDLVPKRAVSIGMGTILKSRRLVLVASGEGKANAIAKLYERMIDPQLPVSFLWLHNDVTLVLDEAAASGIK